MSSNSFTSNNDKYKFQPGNKFGKGRPKGSKNKVTIAAENRYSYHELPQLRDFEVLFKEFDGAPLKYWHDVGHDFVNVSLGIVQKGEYLKRFREQLAGFHVHDVQGIDDHLPIGEGEIKFHELLPVLDSVPYIIELKAGTELYQVQESVTRLKTIMEHRIHESK